MFLSSLIAGSLVAPATWKSLHEDLAKKWPNNREIRIVCHGHSVPAGYFLAGRVQTFDSYPHLFHEQLAKKYPMVPINVVRTAIGGENSVQGAKRFKRDVLSLKPDVVTIDYALNDRGVGVDAAEKAWDQMMVAAKSQSILVILFTPTPDISKDPQCNTGPLVELSTMIRNLAIKHNVKLIDSYASFAKIAAEGKKLDGYMSQGNHPNRVGHQVVADEFFRVFMQTEGF